MNRAGDAMQHLSHIIYIMMENQGFDDVIGHENPSNYGADTPHITALALKYGLETLSFGTTHPSLPNYPFLYFKSIAKNAARLKNVVPLNSMSDLAKTSGRVPRHARDDGLVLRAIRC